MELLEKHHYSSRNQLSISYTNNKFPTSYVPTIFDNYVSNIEIEGKKLSLAIWDTAG